MRKITLTVLSVLALSLAAGATDMHWALKFVGKYSQTFMADHRVENLIATNLGIVVGAPEMAAFWGVPEPVTVAEGRYLSFFSCQARACDARRGFFWVDVSTEESIAALATRSYSNEEGLHDTLKIGGSARSVGEVSPEATHALQSWLNDNSDLNLTHVQYHAPGGVLTNLDPSAYRPTGNH
jgi:hypothetical protein